MRPLDFFRALLREDDALLVRLLLDFFDAVRRELEERFLEADFLDVDFFELDLRPLDFLVAIACLP